MSLEACSPPETQPMTTPVTVSLSMAGSPSLVLEAPPPPNPSVQEDKVADSCTVNGPDSSCTTGESLSPPVAQHSYAKNYVANATSVADLSVLHVVKIPLSCNYEVL